MEDLKARMDDLYERYAASPALGRIAEGRPLVRGYGPPGAPVMVVGEAPGEKEELAGRPFVGPAGKLLRKMLAGAGVEWEACYAANVLCWRPPANREPYPYEVQAAHERLREEIALVDPLVVIAAGATAWRGVTRSEMGPFEQARFAWGELDGRRLLAVPHPSFLLRLKDPAERSQWERATAAAFAGILAAA